MRNWLISVTALLKKLFQKVITPGITTTEDVVWWLRQKLSDMGLTTWFHPTIDVQRNDPQNFEHLRSFSNRPGEEVIMTGDLLHVDFGITYLRLNTDVQEHAYVLRPGETSVPESIRSAFIKTNRLQDILTSKFKEGKSGNQVLSEVLTQAKQENIQASIYTHPLGFMVMQRDLPLACGICKAVCLAAATTRCITTRHIQ